MIFRNYKNLIFFSLILLATNAAAEFIHDVYPNTDDITLISVQNADDVSISIENNSVFPATNFFFTATTDFSAQTISVYIDGAWSTNYTVETSAGSIYPNKITTRWVFPTFDTDIVFTFRTSMADKQNITFCGMQQNPVFGFIDPIPVICCENNRGNINGDLNDVIDIADLVYLVAYSFGSPTGPAPPCFEEGDVNGSGAMDIADVVYLVAFMFGSPTGPAPLACP